MYLVFYLNTNFWVFDTTLLVCFTSTFVRFYLCRLPWVFRSSLQCCTPKRMSRLEVDPWQQRTTMCKRRQRKRNLVIGNTGYIYYASFSLVWQKA